MKLKIKYLYATNLIGVIISMFYGIVGGSGGETTSGVFLILSITGWITILLSIIYSIMNYCTIFKRWYNIFFLLVIIGIAYIETIFYHWRW